ncbi:MAG: hypothetical protein RR400_00580 [Clostridia bacterium]
MVFVFDLDDTICETDKFSEKYILRFFKENNLPIKKIAENVRFAEQKFDWENGTALNWYKTYGDDMLLNFDFKTNALSTINNLYSMGHQIIIATARSTDWHTDPETATRKWLKNNGVNFDKIYFGRVDKDNICKDENADIFIDDDLAITQNVAAIFKACNKQNGKVFLMTTDYNKSFKTPDGVTRVFDFNDFAQKVNALLPQQQKQQLSK